MRASYKHMDFLGQAAMGMLVAERPAPSVSLYMPIALHGGAELQAEPLRLRRLLAQAETQLFALELNTPEVEALLRPATKLTEGNMRFWQHQSDGLALFLTRDISLIYRLPVLFEERVVVGNRFYLRPLLPLLSGDGVFYLLALSQQHVRLWRGSRYKLDAVTVEAIPQSLAEATRFDQVERVRTVHSIASSGTGRGRRPVAFHGQGTASDQKLVKDSLRQFLLQVEGGVTALLADQKAPLILAGVDYLCDLYHSINHYHFLYDLNVEGNPDRTSAEDLHERAWQIVAPNFQRPRAEALARCAQLAGQHSPRAVSQVRTVVSAASSGRVDALFLATDDPIWGNFDLVTGLVTIDSEAQPTGEELLNFALVQTLKNSGTVYAAESHELMNNAPVAALLRA
jgi:hypothetical protein